MAKKALIPQKTGYFKKKLKKMVTEKPKTTMALIATGGAAAACLLYLLGGFLGTISAIVALIASLVVAILVRGWGWAIADQEDQSKLISAAKDPDE